VRQSTRLVVNTLATFSRMALTIGLGLLTTRLLLQALGEVDYGLFMVLGATGALLRFITAALTASTQRHMAVEVGREDPTALQRVFSTALAIYACITVLILIIGLALGPLILRALTIPDDRLDAAWWVFVTAIVSLSVTFLFTPHMGMIAAHQEIFLSTLVELLYAILRLLAAVSLFFLAFDRLIGFALLDLSAKLVMSLLFATVALSRYTSARPTLRAVDWATARELGSFAGWSGLSVLAGLLRQQGSVILVNLQFGPAMNAAYAVALQVAQYAGNLTFAVARAVQPAMVSLEAKGNRAQVRQLTLVSSKYAVLILSCLLVPLWLELPTVLGLWLENVPDYAVPLTAASLFWAITLPSTFGYQMAVQATNEVGWYARLVLGLSVVTLGAAVLAVTVFGLSSVAVPGTLAVFAVVQSLTVASLVGRRIGLTVVDWLRRSAGPSLMVIVPGAAACYAVTLLLPGEAWRVLVTGAAYGVVAAPIGWWLALQPWERQQFVRIMLGVRSRLSRRPKRA